MSTQKIQITFCHSCQLRAPCFHVCCLSLFLCTECLKDEAILAQYAQCQICFRQLESVFRNLTMEARYCQMPNRSNRNIQGNNLRQSKVNQSDTFMRKQSNFQQQVEQEEFQFAESRQQRKQVKKIRNNFTETLNCFQSPNHKNINNQGMKMNNFGQYAQVPQMNRDQNQNFGQTTPFSPRNNFGNNQFTSNKNNRFEPQNCQFDNSYQQNLGYQHQNEMFINNRYSQQQNYGSGCQNIGYTQNIRQKRQFINNNVVNQQNYQNNFCQNSQFQPNPQQLNQGNGNKGNPFSMFNQQSSNNMHTNNFNSSFLNGQNPINFTQQNGDPFRFQNSLNQQQNNERVVKSATKLRRAVDQSPANGKNSFKPFDHQGNHFSSEKELSPSFGQESHNQIFSGAIVPFGKNTQRESEPMEIETNEVSKGMKKSASLYTLGRENGQQEYII